MSKAAPQPPAVSHADSQAASALAPPMLAPPSTLHTQVQSVLDLIRPAVQSDGGDVELVTVSADGVVEVRLHGACVGCPSSAITLQTGIERSLRQRVPGVTAVRAVT